MQILQGFAKWFGRMFALWLSKEFFDATVRPFCQRAISWYRRKTTKAAVVVGAAPEGAMA